MRKPEKRSVTAATFVIDRTYDASPARVFAAFSDPSIKARWFAGPEEWGPDERTMDFKVGGRETSKGGPKGGPMHAMDGRYYDIVPGERIVMAYDMHLDDVRISVSLITVELEAKGAGTRLKLTEQGVYLDGYDNAGQREEGTRELLDSLERELAKG
ncbi:MAG: hypothetical protein JWO86_924 [Myxococcaceae bacterium]|nr:hypothetical protein [Myxococcaceae bacterium]